jgi:hypothetical protein
LTTSMVAPSSASTNSPLMKSLLCTGISHSSRAARARALGAGAAPPLAREPAEPAGIDR